MPRSPQEKPGHHDRWRVVRATLRGAGATLLAPRRSSSLLAAALVATTLAPTAAFAKPGAPGVFCATYPDAPACSAGVVSCSYCHTRSEAPATWNAYGESIRQDLLPGAPRPLDDGAFASALPAALALIADADADADGAANEAEILGGSLPGDAKSHPPEGVCPAEVAGFDYAVCQYDARYVLRKLSLDFCGQSPTMEALAELEAASAADRPKLLDAALDACLNSEFWRGKDGALWKLAHRKIRPIASVKSGDHPGVIPLADYDDDYALFVYTQIDDHDAREVLTASYFVARSDGPPTTYARVDDKQGQILEPGRRAGMITSAWFLVSNVMFTPLARTAAAQAYRAHLGFDIARQEGLHPVAGEPKDHDAKGVGAPACAACHSTLDPLTYPFRNYNGLGKGGRGAYIDDRIEKHYADEAPDITSIPEAGSVLGQPVSNLVEWAQVGAESDAFAAATVMDYWMLAFGAPPTPRQASDFQTLWKTFKTEDAYSVARLLHHLIHTEAYGAP